VRLTVKRGKKRVYKSIKVLKKQCSRKKLSRGSKYGKKKQTKNKKSITNTLWKHKGKIALGIGALGIGAKISSDMRKRIQHTVNLYILPYLHQMYKLGEKTKRDGKAKLDPEVLKLRRNIVLNFIQEYLIHNFQEQSRNPYAVHIWIREFKIYKIFFDTFEDGFNGNRCLHIFRASKAKEMDKIFGKQFGKTKVNYRKKRILSELRELDKDYGLSSKNMSSSLVGFPNWYFLGMKGGNYSERGRMNYFITESAKKGVTMTKPDAKTYVQIMDKIVEKETLSPEDKNFVVQFKLITKSQMNKAAWCLKNPGYCTSVKFVLELAALLGSSAAVMASIMGGVALYLQLINYLAYGTRKRDRESIIQNAQEGSFGKRKRKVKKKN
jgi:hypothetical protein